jgi:hypothetical protein
MGATRRTAIVAAALVAAALVVVLLTRGGSHTERREPPATTHPGKSTAHGKAARRETVRKASGTTPDEPVPGTGALVGIGDQKPATFGDPRFRALGVVRVRLNTPWNSIFTEPRRLAAWLDSAHAAGLEPLVAFEHNRGDACPASPCNLPPLAAYERALHGFHERYPWVHLIQPWNEANSSTQPTGRYPDRAAAYYEAVKRICPDCVVPAADLLDSTNTPRWIARFKAALHGPMPMLWGLHNYSDVNRFRETGTRRVLDLVPGEIWLTETGGIVRFTTATGRVALPRDPQRAARATRFMFRLAARFSRIKRVYIYQWKIDFAGNRFDAGLVDASGHPRPALAVVEEHAALVR